MKSYESSISKPWNTGGFKFQNLFNISCSLQIRTLNNKGNKNASLHTFTPTWGTMIAVGGLAGTSRNPKIYKERWSLLEANR